MPTQKIDQNLVSHAGEQSKERSSNEIIGRTSDSLVRRRDINSQPAARLDWFMGEFLTLTSQLLATPGQNNGLQQRLIQVFRQPTTSRLVRHLVPNETLPSGMSIGFERGAKVTLEEIPKADFGTSPETCINTLRIRLIGPSRWLALQFPCDWQDISAARRFQLGIYGVASQTVSWRGLLNLPGKRGNSESLVFAQFQYSQEQRNLNMSGEIPAVDFVDLNTDRRPSLLFDMATNDMPTFTLDLHYLSLYFE